MDMDCFQSMELCAERIELVTQSSMGLFLMVFVFCTPVTIHHAVIPPICGSGRLLKIIKIEKEKAVAQITPALTVSHIPIPKA